MGKLLPCLLLTLLIVGRGSAQATAERPLVSVVGEAEITVTPDQASFTLEVITLDKDLVAAKRANDASAAKTLAVARAHQIADPDVQTVNLTITPRYTNPREARGERVFVGYEITRRISIMLRDVGKIDSLLGSVLGSGVNRVVDVSFENSQIRKHREQARTLAIKNAQDKARAYAQQLGQNIGKAFSIVEEGAEGAAYGAGGGPGGGGGGDYETAKVAAGRPVSSEVTFALGQIKIEERVIVSFLLE